MNYTHLGLRLALAVLFLGTLISSAYERPGSPSPTDYVFLAEDGVSAYVIHHAAEAPTSVKHAAKELQRVLRTATGVEIPIRLQPADPMIGLGDNAAARGAGLSGQALPYEHYRIVALAGNIYIVGRDTADGETTAWNGVSRGTEFGVYTFLERYVGARWLMPGELGEEIPCRPSLAVTPMDISEGPAFAYRTLSVKDPPDPETWANRHKISTRDRYANDACSFVVSAGHNWHELMPPELRKAHPEWDAVSGEKNKFCTRRPDAVAAFATNAVRWLRDHPGRHIVSVSPSDGQQFCRCDRCASFTAKDPHGQNSVTRNLLDLYNDVAHRVATEIPNAMVGGYAYGRATYPPSTPVGLEPNVFIDWYALNYYGLGLYKPGFMEEFEDVAAAWRALTPNVGYGNYCHWHRSQNGAPYAPAPSIMKMQFPVLRQLGYRTIWEAGTSEWAYGALNNYLLAKLMWDADADVDALYAEWLKRAYGAGADHMRAMYELLDAGFREFKRNQESFLYHGDNYEIKTDKIQAIYLPILDRIGTLYTRALERVRAERPRRRIELFGANMVVFHFHLRTAGYLDEPQRSVFYRSDADYSAFLKQVEPAWLRTQLQRLRPLPPRAEWTGFTPQKRTLTIPRIPAGRSIDIDGTVTAAEWASAAVATDFVQVGVNAPAEQATTVRVASDSTHLYVAFECAEEQIGEIKAREHLDDGMRILDGNTVQVLLRPADATTWSWRFAVTPANSRWDGRDTPGLESPDPLADLVWSSATAHGDGLWSVEIAIPFASFNVDDPVGTTWRVNLARTRSVAGLWQRSTWNPVKRAFHEPEHFGEWHFKRPWKAIR